MSQKVIYESTGLIFTIFLHYKKVHYRDVIIGVHPKSSTIPNFYPTPKWTGSITPRGLQSTSCDKEVVYENISTEEVTNVYNQPPS